LQFLQPKLTQGRYGKGKGKGKRGFV